MRRLSPSAGPAHTRIRGFNFPLHFDNPFSG
jgi:hypothetical protein